MFTLPSLAVGKVQVHGYYRRDGTYVKPYERTAPDGDPTNNYNYPGNCNPNKESCSTSRVLPVDVGSKDNAEDLLIKHQQCAKVYSSCLDYIEIDMYLICKKIAREAYDKCMSK